MFAEQTYQCCFCCCYCCCIFRMVHCEVHCEAAERHYAALTVTELQTPTLGWFVVHNN